jgi:hypothetical protein
MRVLPFQALQAAIRTSSTPQAKANSDARSFAVMAETLTVREPAPNPVYSLSGWGFD